MHGRALAAAIVAACVLVAPAARGAGKEETPWVEPMREVHGRFTGKPGTLALFGDSIFVSLAFWAPLAGDPKDLSPDMAGALRRVKSRQEKACWREWRGPEFGNEGRRTIRWADENVGAWLEKLRPEVAVILFGTNDLAVLDREEFEEKMRGVVKRCLEKGTVVILTTLPPRHGLAEKAALFAESVRRVASDLKVPLIDYHAEIVRRRKDDWDGSLPQFRSATGKDESAYDVPTLIAGDGVHPSNPKDHQGYSEKSLNANGYVLLNYLTLSRYAQVIELVLERSPPEGTAAPRITLRGTWVAAEDGRPVSPGSFKRGLQTSGLVARGGELWSIGDQRSEFPGHVFRIDPATARLAGPPVRLELPDAVDGEDAEIAAYRGIPNSDFEALAAHPKDPAILFAVTEDKIPWIAEIRLEAAPARARILRLVRIPLPEDTPSWRNDPNFRMEGAAVSDDAGTMYLAFERASDDLPRVYRVPVADVRSGKPIRLELQPVDFASVPRRADKPRARLNLNDIQFLRIGGKPALLAVARDQERVLLIDLDAGKVTRVVDLVLLDPGGGAIEWVSPEGIAFDREKDRLWIINDPDSVETNYRARGASAPEGLFAEYSPLLFELKLSEVLGEKPGSAGGS